MLCPSVVNTVISQAPWRWGSDRDGKLAKLLGEGGKQLHSTDRLVSWSHCECVYVCVSVFIGVCVCVCRVSVTASNDVRMFTQTGKH